MASSSSTEGRVTNTTSMEQTIETKLSDYVELFDALRAQVRGASAAVAILQGNRPRCTRRENPRWTGSGACRRSQPRRRVCVRRKRGGTCNSQADRLAPRSRSPDTVKPDEGTGVRNAGRSSCAERGSLSTHAPRQAAAAGRLLTPGYCRAGKAAFVHREQEGGDREASMRSRGAGRGRQRRRLRVASKSPCAIARRSLTLCLCMT
jgi:hypothetical protein